MFANYLQVQWILLVSESFTLINQERLMQESSYLAITLLDT